MITIVFNKEGYYVNGEGVEYALRCSPALDDHGNPIFHELHHTYKVLFLALRELVKKSDITGDIIVYNDSRIIDELNSNISPLDETCKRWHQIIRRQLIPRIRSIVFFRKKNSDYIKSQLKNREAMLCVPNNIGAIASKMDKIEKEETRNFKMRIINNFRKTWKNE